MNKLERQKQILKIIRDEEVHTQESLAQLLGKRGIEATQVTLSRDIRDLGLLKTPQGYAEMNGPAAKFLSLAREFMVSAQSAQNLVVLKSTPGHAMSLAIALDEEVWPNVMGTLAGDDTIFVAMPDSDSAKKFATELSDLLA